MARPGSPRGGRPFRPVAHPLPLLFASFALLLLTLIAASGLLT